MRQALNSCLKQKPRPEILVIDDGSTDGTAEFVKANYSEVRLVRSEESRGCIARRNEAATLTDREVIISIDDDAVFSQNNIIAEILNQFTDPRIAAVAIPFVNVKTDHTMRQYAPDLSQIWITNEFIGTAYAIRRKIFQEAGGFRCIFIHQEEEGDLCIRLLQKGYFIRLGSSAPIQHFESTQRSLEHMNFYGQRNLIVFAWFNVPLSELLFHLPITIIKGLLWGLKRGFFLLRLKGTLAGFGAIVSQFRGRAPVSRKTYWLYRRLKKCGPLPLPMSFKR